MKKRILTLLAVVALLVTCLALTVQAKTDKATFEANYGLCPCGCGENIADIDWNTGGTLYNEVESGHYIKTGNFGPGLGATIAEGKTVVIYLDGSAASSRVKWGKHDTKTNDKGADLNFRTFNVMEGGKLYIIGNNATVTGAAVAAGSSDNYQHGGIIYVANGAELNLSGDLLVEVNSVATNVPRLGGVIYNAGTTTLDGVTLNGYSAYNGGGIYNTGTLTIENSVVGGGRASYRGGTLYNTGTLNVTDSTLNGGYSANRGGPLFTSGGTATIHNTQVNAYTGTDLTGQKYRGIMVAGGNTILSGTTMVKSANTALGDGVALTSGNLTLLDSATVYNEAGTKLNNIWRYTSASATSFIRIDDDWTGTGSLWVTNSLSGHGGGITGARFGNYENGTWTDGTSGTAERTGMYLEFASHDNPRLAGYQQYLSTCRAQLVEDGVATDWYVTHDNAVTAYKNSKATEKYIKLWADRASTASVDVCVDFNGYAGGTWTISEGKTLYAFDSTVAVGAEGAKTITTAGAGTLSPITQINGKTYVVNSGKVYPVEAKITGVSLRASSEALYYTAEFNAHENVKFAAAGVAVNVKNPDSTDLNDYLYTAAPNSQAAYTGVLVYGIVGEGDDQADRANQDVTARAYFTIDGETVMSEKVAYSIADVVNAIIAQGEYEKLEEGTAKANFEALYEKLAAIEGVEVAALPGKDEE